MKELLSIRKSYGIEDYYSDVLSLEDGGDHLNINIQDPDHYVSMNLDVVQVKNLIKALEAWVKQ